MAGDPVEGGEEFLNHIVVSLLAHALGDDEHQTHLIRALDALQDLFGSKVPLVNIPAPTSSDLRLLALAACTVERLVEVWRTPPHDRNGEQTPSWCAAIRPLDDPLWLIAPDFADLGLNAIFEQRNIKALPNFLMFA